MGQVSHNIIVKVQEVYSSEDRIHLISPNLGATHASLAELNQVLDETKICVILQHLLQMLCKLHRDGVTVCNLHPGNVFIDEDNEDDVLVTDVGFAYVPGMLPETQL